MSQSSNTYPDFESWFFADDSAPLIMPTDSTSRDLMPEHTQVRPTGNLLECHPFSAPDFPNSVAVWQQSPSNDSGIGLSPPVANPDFVSESWCSDSLTSFDASNGCFSLSTQAPSLALDAASASGWLSLVNDFNSAAPETAPLDSFDFNIERTGPNRIENSASAVNFSSQTIEPAKEPARNGTPPSPNLQGTLKSNANLRTQMASRKETTYSSPKAHGFQCDICSRLFTRSRNLRLHQRTHPEIRHLHKESYRAPSVNDSFESIDSGYHSVRATEMGPTYPVPGAPTKIQTPSFLQKLIAFFGNHLIEEANIQLWAVSVSSRHSFEEIRTRLAGLIKEFALELVSDIPPSWGSNLPRLTTRVQTDEQLRKVLIDITQLLRLRRPEIAQYICENAFSKMENERPICEANQVNSSKLSRKESMALLGDDAEWAGDGTEYVLDDEGLCATAEPFREHLVQNKAFGRLVQSVRTSLYHNDHEHMNSIQKELVCETPAMAHRYLLGQRALAFEAKLNVNWDLAGYMSSQYGQKPTSLASVVTVTGSALYAQATTCAEYMAATWPRTATFLIDVLDEALRVDEEPKTAHKAHRSLLLEIYLEIHTGGKLLLSISANSTALLVDLAQQVGWLGSALSISPFGDQLACAKPSFKLSGARNWTVQFEHEDLHPSENPCWLPLFSGAVIASGFPIPERANEMGLEISLELLTAMAGVCHAVEYDGGIVMKGYSHMFVPVRQSGDRLQWHATTSQDSDTRLTYSAGLSQCGPRALSDEVTLEDIRRLRPIVGWCSIAVSNLGSSTANYENIDYSGATDAESSLRCAGGSLGFQQFGAAQLNFRFGVKDGKCHFQRTGPFQRIVSAAENTMVALYDTGEQRAWLVPASNVLLHMVQHRHYLEPFELNAKPIILDTTIAVGSSAKQTLLKNASVRLSDSEDYTFKDFILNTWSLLEFLIDQDVTRDRNSAGTSVKGTLREYLYGYEFKAVVQERAPFRRKEVQLSKTHGGWPLLLRDIDALVLFADGFEDLIVPCPRSNAGLCRSWQRVPKGKDYLATTTKTLKDLYDVAGCRLSRKYLTSTHLQWHKGDSRVVPKSAIGEVVTPDFILDQGAVVFGHSGHTIQRRTPKSQTQTSNAMSLYSHPNLALKPTCGLKGFVDSGFFEDTALDRATLQSSPDSLTSGDTLAEGDETEDELDYRSFSRKRFHEPDTNTTRTEEIDSENTGPTTPKRAKNDQEFVSGRLSLGSNPASLEQKEMESITSGLEFEKSASTAYNDPPISAFSGQMDGDTIMIDSGLSIRLEDSDNLRSLRHGDVVLGGDRGREAPL
ncbi:hypothetical protein CC80DRAFT_482470 [Byssothecium circinans]|uniref:C2H2-type domain-containing protein n=1 Tax=Byssothecium circinans TaxID=147558 RepID=A0A6A5TCV5_9PLEO|nr:hypothetical protein CC80DRAFT_482470 [Byssothecium circinans]